MPKLSDIKIDKEKLRKKFTDVKSLINIEIMKCYKVLFTKSGLLKNIGSYIILSFIFIYIISYILFFNLEYDIIYHKIEEIFKKLFNSKNNKNKEKENKVKKKNKKKKKNSRKKNDNKVISTHNIESKSKMLINNEVLPTNKENKKRSFNKSNNSNKSKTNLDLENHIIIFDQLKNNNNLQSINSPKINNNNNVIEFNDYELNTMNYDDALKHDKRNFILYYWSLLRTKHILLFAIIPSNDYNSTLIKICLFLFSFALYYTINGLFFTDSTIHEIYEEKGKYNFIYQLPKIIYSSVISSFFSIVIRFFSLFEKNVLKFKNKNNKDDNLNEKMMRLMKILKIKSICFFILGLSFLIFFWYYLSCFCAVYKNSQKHLIKDTLISFSLSLLYPFGIYLLPGLFRIPSLKNNKKKCMYNVSKIIQLI